MQMTIFNLGMSKGAGETSGSDVDAKHERILSKQSKSGEKANQKMQASELQEAPGNGNSRMRREFDCRTFELKRSPSADGIRPRASDE